MQVPNTEAAASEGKLDAEQCGLESTIDDSAVEVLNVSVSLEDVAVEVIEDAGGAAAPTPKAEEIIEADACWDLSYVEKLVGQRACESK